MRNALFALAALLAAAVPAQAGVRPYDLQRWLGAATAVRPTDSAKDWRLNVGMGAIAAPDYLGGEDYATHPLPLIDVEWRGAFFLSTQRGAGVALFRTRQFSAGVRFTVDPGRDSDVNQHLAPLDTIDPTPEAGLFGIYYKGPWRLEADVRRGFAGDHEGIVASLGAAYGNRIGERISLIVGGNLHIASAAFLQAYYGVTAAQATAALPQFAPSGGFRNTEGYIQIIYDIDPNFYLALDLRAGLMLGDAGQSPVTLSDAYAGLGSVLGYRF